MSRRNPFEVAGHHLTPDFRQLSWDKLRAWKPPPYEWPAATLTTDVRDWANTRLEKVGVRIGTLFTPVFAGRHSGIWGDVYQFETLEGEPAGVIKITADISEAVTAKRILDSNARLQALPHIFGVFILPNNWLFIWREDLFHLKNYIDSDEIRRLARIAGRAIERGILVSGNFDDDEVEKRAAEFCESLVRAHGLQLLSTQDAHGENIRLRRTFTGWQFVLSDIGMSKGVGKELPIARNNSRRNIRKRR